MPLPFTFGPPTTSATGTNLDDDFNAIARYIVTTCTITGTNTLVLAPFSDSPAVSAYRNIQIFSGRAAATNTSTVTASVSGLATLNVYKDTPSGPTLLSGGEIVINNYFQLVYDSLLNSGSGGFHLLTTPATSAGTVTSVATGSGLAGGPVTTTGTISLASISDSRLQANISGGSAAPIANTLTGILDHILGTTQGSIINRSASAWIASTETSWNPVISFGGASTGVTYTTQVGQYLAIGFLTVAMFNIVLSSKGSSTGNAAITIPATSGGGNRVGGGILTNYANLSSVTTLPWAQIGPSATTAPLVVEGTGTVTALVDTNFTNTSSLSGILLFFTG